MGCASEFRSSKKKGRKEIAPRLSADQAVAYERFSLFASNFVLVFTFGYI